MARRAEAYVDTSALIALADRSDTYHPLFRRLFSEPPRLLTTPLRIVSVGARRQQAGVELLRRLSDQRLTLTDAVGLYLMKEREVGSCWSTDSHLGLTGVPLVIHQV